MNFQVPQFIEVENKLIGPLSLKQFLYLAGGAGIVYLIFRLNLPLFIKIIPMVIVGALSLALAFYKINQRPFVDILDSVLKYMFGKKLYLWQQGPLIKKEVVKNKKEGIQVIPKLSESKLNEMAWSLDVKEKKE